MVVKDESQFIGDAIASAAPIVDEVVVVDTGSVDETVDIARRAGARVFRARWPGDLGKAHQLPLDHAHGDWVLALDADEALDPGSRGRIPELLDVGDVEGYRLAIRNYSYVYTEKWRWCDPTHPFARGTPGFLPTRVVRLFRRRPAYRYSGMLHQTMEPAIVALGGRVADADVAIHHYGFLRTDKLKGELYVRLA
ncbi:MAG: glycosyltransferase family 2 protein, partial [Chloroflexota bacterium]|nr:glycosyltransferase family 2 protein [Chloroflexota bacterium]